MTLHVFDFDGVLFDTARECLSVAYAAARKRPGSPWRDETPPAEVASLFLANRHWVGPPWQYAVLLECIARGTLPATTNEFLAIAAAREPELGAFTELYFATRGELAEDVARWCSVIEPYPPAIAAFSRLAAAGTARILSTRDDLSVRRILAHFTGIVPELLPRAGPRPKWQHLLDAAQAHGLPPGRVFFLDDYVHHAQPARERGVAAHLALCGYLGPDDIDQARAAGLPSVQLAELERALARHEQENHS